MKTQVSGLNLRPADGARLETLVARGWTLAGNEHPLGQLQGQGLGPYRLVTLLGPKNSVGARYFQLFLADEQGRLTRQPLAWGMHNTGPFPGFNWIELTRYDAAPSLDSESADLTAQGLERQLFACLSELVPPGGHLMVEYESPSQRASERMLAAGYPPAATPLGYLLFLAGCRSFRDWYIPEGGREGPRKLQGFKPLDDAVAAEKRRQLEQQLVELLAGPATSQRGEWGRAARTLAGTALEVLAAESGAVAGGRGEN